MRLQMRLHTPLLAGVRLPALRAALLTCSMLGAGLPARPLTAQDVRIYKTPQGERKVMINDDRPMIGVTTAAESERGDTLGLRISAVRAGSPAEKAGLKEGDRLQSVNGVNLRADRADAGEEDYAGVLNRRLQREVQRTAAGAAIELRVLSGTQARTVRVTPSRASEFMADEARGFRVLGEDSDRAALGLSVMSTGSPRDTLGVFVQSVAHDGPAEKAGIYEGDRIAAINGVSLRVAREDAADEAVGPARAERLSREVAKLKAGEVAELTVVTAGRPRTVRVTTVKASDLPEGAEASFFRMRMPELEGMRRRIEIEGQGEPNVVIRRRVRPDAAPGSPRE